MIHHRIQGALSLAEQLGRAPLRLWLTHADWDALLASAPRQDITINVVRYCDTPVTLDTYGQETRLITEDGNKIYF